MRNTALALGILGLCWTGVAAGAEGLSFGGFLDVYGAYDFNRPPGIDRAFTTQAARDREFNVNLAHLEAKLARERVRGRLALQAGTSVQSNTAGEPAIGSVSGPSLSRHIQEAVVGYRLGSSTWIDGGIYFSHLGLESFVSQSNPTYTRSLVAEFSPYYQSGLRLSHAWDSKVSAQLHLINGWQNVSENNSAKAVGTQLAYAPVPGFSVSYSTFLGREPADFRHFHDLVVQLSPDDYWSFAAQLDLGFQGDSRWHGFTAIARRKLSGSVALAGRLERYADPDQVIAVSSAGSPLRTWGGSLGVDVALDEGIAWRSEWRGLWAPDAIFPSHDGWAARDALLVTALTASF